MPCALGVVCDGGSNFIVEADSGGEIAYLTTGETSLHLSKMLFTEVI